MPESILRWRERDLRSESWLNSDGNSPERNLEVRLIEVTRPKELQETPDHLQGFVPRQSEGVGLRDLASLAIMKWSPPSLLVSFAEEAWRIREEKVIMMAM